MGGLHPGSLRTGVALRMERRQSANERLMSQAVHGCCGPTFTVFVNVYSCGHCATLHFEICSQLTSRISGPWMKNLTGCQLTGLYKPLFLVLIFIVCMSKDAWPVFFFFFSLQSTGIQLKIL